MWLAEQLFVLSSWTGGPNKVDWKTWTQLVVVENEEEHMKTHWLQDLCPVGINSIIQKTELSNLIIYIHVCICIYVNVEDKYQHIWGTNLETTCKGMSTLTSYIISSCIDQKHNSYIKYWYRSWCCGEARSNVKISLVFKKKYMKKWHKTPNLKFKHIWSTRLIPG